MLLKIVRLHREPFDPRFKNDSIDICQLGLVDRVELTQRPTEAIPSDIVIKIYDKPGKDRFSLWFDDRGYPHIDGRYVCFGITSRPPIYALYTTLIKKYCGVNSVYIGFFNKDMTQQFTKSKYYTGLTGSAITAYYCGLSKQWKRI